MEPDRWIADIAGDYLDALMHLGDSGPPALRCETLYAPHRPPKLPAGFGAVYVFALAADYRRGRVGPRRVLKVGKAGPTSNARFQYQHYNPNSAPSNLASSLLDARVLWPYLGIERMTEGTVKPWLLNNSDRHHVYMSADDYDAHGAQIEKYVRSVAGPVYEG